MDYHKCLDALQKTEEDIWVDKINEVCNNGRLSDWLTPLLPGQDSWRLDGNFMNGSYNVCQKITSNSSGIALLLRLPRISSVSSKYADEKVVMEMEALDLIRKKTTIPVPEVHAWGLAETNPLGLGPFILMKYIDGVCLKDLFLGAGSRLLKEEIPDCDIESIYRQMANFMLQLFNIDFPRIGSLPTPSTGFSAPIRPLTWKVNDIIQNGGVNTFGDRTRGFTTTGEYFRYLIEQDEQQLQHQPNSAVVAECAGSNLASLKILKSIMPEMINEKYDKGPFKLICDDFGPANVLVKSQHDLTIVGVVDLEWVYAGPAQLFASGPWWLLLDRPVNEEWDSYAGEPPAITGRYLKHLAMFKRVLGEEEAKIPEHREREVSKLVQWSEDSGAIWLHMLLSSGFFDWLTFPCIQLRQRVGAKNWNEKMNAIKDTEEAKKFVAKKMRELEDYDEKVDKVEHYKALKDGAAMSKEEFVATVLAVLNGDAGA